MSRLPDKTIPGVMHLVDTLEFGGAERAAVNYVNHLPPSQYRAFLCTTRRSGPLERYVAPQISILHLNRRRMLDVVAIQQLRKYVQSNGIRLLHAHGSTLFVARVVQMALPGTALVWHLHYGRWAEEDRRDWRWVLASLRIDAVVTANDDLARWVAKRFPIAASRVMHLRNMVTLTQRDQVPVLEAGAPGARILCLANLRPEKDHLTLLRAFASVVKRVPGAHLYLVGGEPNAATAAQIRKALAASQLADKVTFMGPQPEVSALLQQADIGVLSSATEGLPMALLEYGAAGLPVVSTAVGQIPTVLNAGKAGLLVPPSDSDALAAALVRLLESEDLRRTLGGAFRVRVNALYSPDAVIPELCDLYSRVLSARRKAA